MAQLAGRGFSGSFSGLQIEVYLIFDTETVAIRAEKRTSATSQAYVGAFFPCIIVIVVGYIQAVQFFSVERFFIICCYDPLILTEQL